MTTKDNMFAASSPPSFRSHSSVCFRSRPLRVAAACASAQAPASLYQVLGVSSGATCHEIKAAYRRLARIWHPDVVARHRRDASADEFMKVHAAYSTLSDPKKRAEYDRKLLQFPPPPSFPSHASSWPHYRWPASFGARRRRTWETDQCW